MWTESGQHSKPLPGFWRFCLFVTKRQCAAAFCQRNRQRHCVIPAAVVLNCTDCTSVGVSGRIPDRIDSVVMAKGPISVGMASSRATNPERLWGESGRERSDDFCSPSEDRDRLAVVVQRVCLHRSGGEGEKWEKKSNPAHCSVIACRTASGDCRLGWMDV